jgi:hypothetical protein
MGLGLDRNIITLVTFILDRHNRTKQEPRAAIESSNERPDQKRESLYMVPQEARDWWLHTRARRTVESRRVSTNLWFNGGIVDQARMEKTD